ncbi:MAG: Hpt domain-containing protein [Rhodocyclales bacterium]|nr:Hpt domain-containing protein [Rhodocyclales bacterium]
MNLNSNGFDPTDAPAEADSAAALRELPGIDAAVGLGYVGHKPLLYFRLLVKFRDGHGRNFAPDFCDAAARGDWAEARRLAHTLKSVARTLGALPLGELASRLEEICREQRDAAAATGAPLPRAGDADGLLRAPTEAVIAELATVVSGLKGLDAPAAEDAGDKTPQELLTRLAYLLRSRDTAANDLAIECDQAFGKLGYAAAAGAIVSAVGRYDYEQALHGVLELARELRIAVEG